MKNAKPGFAAALSLLVALGSCAYRSDGEGRHATINNTTPTTPPGALAPTDSKPAAPPPADRKLSEAARNSGIKGIELFDRQVTVVTVVCSAHTYDINYSGKAATALAAKPGGPSVSEVLRVDVSLRCHPKGFANIESACHATTDIVLNLVPPGGRAPTATKITGDGDASTGALCEGGADAVDAAMTSALARAGRIMAESR